MTEDAGLGPVAGLRRYPVKSMLGEDLTAADVTSAGLAGDRVLGLVHRQTGKVASAKNPRTWRRLLALRAAGRGAAVTITFPGGTAMAGSDPGIDAALPEEVLRDGVRAPVSVEVSRIGGASAANNFVDFAPLHLLTTAALDRIGALSPRGTVELERYRPNIVIRAGLPGFAENDWPGHDLRIGPELVIRVIARTPRCAIPTLEHGELPRDTHALRVPAEHNRISAMAGFGPQPCAGVYAQVLRPGRIRLGDIARLA